MNQNLNFFVFLIFMINYNNHHQFLKNLIEVNIMQKISNFLINLIINLLSFLNNFHFLIKLINFSYHLILLLVL